MISSQTRSTDTSEAILVGVVAFRLCQLAGIVGPNLETAHLVLVDSSLETAHLLLERLALGRDTFKL
jgi:hypothetical protein